MKTTAIALSAMICFLANTENVSAQYSDTVVMTQQVECTLPQILHTTTVLKPCTSPDGFGDLQVGDTAFIVYSASNCATTCIQGTSIDISAFFNVSSSAGISELHSDLGITIFPQPTNGFFTIKSPQTVESIELFSPSGEKIISINGQGKNSIDISGYENGVYLLKVTTKKGTSTLKVTKI